MKTKILNNWGSKCPNGPSPSDCYHPALTPEPCPHNSPRVDRKQLSSEGEGEAGPEETAGILSSLEGCEPGASKLQWEGLLEDPSWRLGISDGRGA